METRKVQITGGSTFTVSLPKDWATRNGVEAGSRLEFYPDGELLVITPDGEDERSTGSLDVTGIEGEDLVRAVISMYVSGFDVISLESSRITTAQRRAVRSASQGLVGIEVLEETSDRVVLQDLLDSSELSIHNAIGRMRLIAGSMLDDSIEALLQDDDDLATDVVERDDDVDRLWFVVSRTFRSTLRNPGAIEELGLPREVCFDYHTSARQIERIADHATKIGRISLELGAVPEPIAEAVRDLHGEAAGVLETAMDALLADDRDEATRLANDAQRVILEIDERVRSIDDLLRDLDPHEAHSLGLVVDSLSRCADYAGNIAETALQKATPRP